jgi:hypothetical protein
LPGVSIARVYNHKSDRVKHPGSSEKAMRVRSWLIGVIIGVVTGLIVAVPMTIRDWRLNPSNLFHNEQGTDWAVVIDTALSWFWPVGLAALITTVIVHSWLSRDRTN